MNTFNSIITKLIKLLTKKGKTTQAEKIIKIMFFELAIRKYNSKKVILVAFSLLQPFFKMRNTRVRGTFFLVPLPRTKEQQFFYILKAILEEASTDKKRFPIVIAEEFIKLYEGKDNAVENKIDNMNIEAIKNKAFSSYRWF
jgi:ribosomal protein S7